MADNYTTNPGAGGATFASEEIAGLHWPYAKLAWGAVDTATPVSATDPLPVAGPLTDDELRATAVPVSGPLTDDELRATPVPVSGPLTDAELRATAVPVSGPLTDTQLRATAVPVSGPLTDDELRATAVPVSGPLTDDELRATAVPVSGPLTDVQLRTTAVPVSGPLTDDELRATAVPVSGPLTDDELRATAVPVSGPLTDAELRATAVPVSGPLTDTQLRATAVPVSGPLTDDELRATAVPVSGPLTDDELRATAVPVSTGLTEYVDAGAVPSHPSGTAIVYAGAGNTWLAVGSAHPLPVDLASEADVSLGDGTGYKLVSAATTNATSVVAQEARLVSLFVSNTATAARYLKLYNKASAPTVGSDTPIQTYLIPAATGGAGFAIALPVPLLFSTGLAFALTTGAADADTGAVGAAEVVVNLIYKA